MDSTTLSRSQAARLWEQVGRRLRYVGALRRRMELVGFPPDDPMYRATAKAFDGLQELSVRAHYASCASGVGRAGHAN
jgi:hypothetical protein